MKGFLVPIFLILAAMPLVAQDQDKISNQTRIEKESATVTGDRGLFDVPSVETLNKKQFAFGVGWNNIDRTPRDLDITTYPVYLSYGLFSRLTVTAAIDSVIQIKASNLVQPGFYSPLPFVSKSFSQGVGDTYLSAKYRLWRQKDNIGGIALRGTVKAGTASTSKGLCTGQTHVDGDLIFTSALPLGFLLDSLMAFNATHSTTTPSAVVLKDEVKSGLGVAWPASGLKVGGSRVQGIFEYETGSFIGASSPNAATVAIQDPSDLTGGIRILMLNHGITLSGGYRVNTKFDLTFPNNSGRTGYTFGLSYTKPVPAIQRNQYPVVALEADSVEVAAGGNVTITASGYDADNDPLTYLWTSTGGRIEGTGEKVTFRTTGLAPGKYTVRVTANDGRGGLATAEVEITVRP